MSADQYLEYFYKYADHFNLRSHILLNTEVLRVVPVNCSEDDNNMKLLSTGYPEKFEAVMESFSGKVIHSVEYQDWKPFEDQKVIVCGLGNTGGKFLV